MGDEDKTSGKLLIRQIQNMSSVGLLSPRCIYVPHMATLVRDTYRVKINRI